MADTAVTEAGCGAGARNAVRSVQVSARSFGTAARILPVSEFVFTQLGRGQFQINATSIATADVVLTRMHVSTRSAGIVVPDPSVVAFLLPMRCQGPYVYNGSELTPASLCVAGGLNGYHTHGNDRESITIGLARSRLTATIAALRGVDPDQFRLHDCVLTLSRPAAERLRARLAAIIDSNSGGRAATHLEQAQHGIREEVYQLLIDAYLNFESAPDAGARRLAQRKEIVRRAEDRFLAAEGQPLSLADLCAAAGVGRTALQQAFQSIYGESPLGYFHKRRLTQARQTLLLPPSGRAPVKRAALGAGLMALGRFAVEYRQLFGESPSATLSDSGR